MASLLSLFVGVLSRLEDMRLKEVSVPVLLVLSHDLKIDLVK